MAGAEYPRSSATSDPAFGPDRGWGTSFIVLYSLLLTALFGIAAAGISSVSVGGPATNTAAKPDDGPAEFVGIILVIGLIAGLLLAIAVGAQIYCAVGIRRSRAWGFQWTIALSVLSIALISPVGGIVGFCFAAIPLVYSILRLTARYGPKPT